MGDPITLLVQPAEINNDQPREEYILASVQGIHTGRAGVLLVMWLEHLKMWIREATQDRDPIIARWEAVVSMVHLEF